MMKAARNLFRVFRGGLLRTLSPGARELKRKDEALDRLFLALPRAHKAVVHPLLVALITYQKSTEEGQEPEGSSWMNERHVLARTWPMEVIEDHEEWTPTEKMAGILQSIWTDHSPFTLYLRTFSVGASATGTLNENEEMTFVGPQDLRMTERLYRLAGETSVICIANPVLGPAETTQIRYHDREWRQRVSELMQAAAVIVLYVSEATEGVRDEVDLICATQRESSTLVVVAAPRDDSLNDVVVEAAREFYGLEWLEKRRSITAGIPLLYNTFAAHVLMETSPTFEQELRETWQTLFNQVGSRKFSPTPPIPSLPLIRDEDVKEILSLARGALTNAYVTQARGEFGRAESHYHHALGYFFCAQEVRGRAAAYLYLGRMYLASGSNFYVAARLFHLSARAYRRLRDQKMELAALTANAGACLCSVPPLLLEARASLEKAHSLVPIVGDDWEAFSESAMWELLETKEGNQLGAQQAREVALKAYGEFRARGNPARTPKAQLWSEMSEAFRRETLAGRRTFLSRYIPLNAVPEIRATIKDCLAGRNFAKELYSIAESLDERWEMEHFIDLVSRGPS